MSRDKTLLWIVLGVGAAAALATGGVMAVSAWKQSTNAAKWAPTLAAAEIANQIPTNLLARVAYQESHYRSDIISGATVSPAGALGLMQLEPQYFSSVRVPRPFSDADTAAQISQAATELARLYGVFGDWTLALAAYNDGQGNVSAYVAGNRDLPAETQQYVAEIVADVPVPGVLV